MLFPTALAHIVAGALTLPIAFAAPYISPSDRRNGHPWNQGPSDVLKPKIVIISMFSYEADVWHGIPEFDLLEKNVTVTGFSPQYPEAHCTANGEICQVITAMGGTYYPNTALSFPSLYSGYLLYPSWMRVPVVIHDIAGMACTAVHHPRHADPSTTGFK